MGVAAFSAHLEEGRMHVQRDFGYCFHDYYRNDCRDP